MKRISWPTFFALALSLTCLQAQETEPSKAPVSAEEKDWLEFFYEDPKPERLVAEVKLWAREGTLENESALPAVIAFLSQVFRQNPDKIAGWYQQLLGLSAEHRQIIHTALLFSRTAEADAVLEEQFGKKFEEEKQATSKILEMNLAQKNTLDMLWGYFYATGSKSAIRRIIWSFRFDYAPDDPEFAKIPKDHLPLYKLLPDAAAWSLEGNAHRHPKVLEFCEDIYANDKELVPAEKKRLHGVLIALKPEKYPPDAKKP